MQRSLEMTNPDEKTSEEIHIELIELYEVDAYSNEAIKFEQKKWLSAEQLKELFDNRINELEIKLERHLINIKKIKEKNRQSSKIKLITRIKELKHLKQKWLKQ